MSGINIFLGVVALVLSFVAFVALVWSERLREKSGLPEGDLIYSDTGGIWHPQQEPLYSPELHLSGKPDYLVQEADGQIIPVEVKSSRAPRRPYDGHVMQLAAYCALVEVHYGVRPDYGIIQYRDQAFEVAYDYELEDDLFDLIATMREDLFAADVARSHDDVPRCAACGVRDHCTESLA